MLGPGVTPPTSDSSTRRCTLALYPDGAMTQVAERPEHRRRPPRRRWAFLDPAGF